MIDILYTVFIFPIELIIELSYLFAFRVSDNPALSILGVSFAVTIFTLPLYFMAEKYQHSERDIQEQMKPEANNIKAVFSGDERFMRLATYYRQNKYHPLYSLRSSISLIIQIPFFIAAYHFLSNLEMIKGVSFGPIVDLGKPDSLFTIKNISINILPIVMTLINCLSALIYSKGFSARDKIQLYGMAALFLILLYNSPSGLALYWTANNFFSLVKNIIQKTKKPKLVTIILVSALCLFLDIYLLFIHDGVIIKRLLSVFLVTVIPLFSFLSGFFTKKYQKLFIFRINQDSKKNTLIFILAVLILFLLAGFVIPSALIASSVQEFSLIYTEITNPFTFIGNVILQSIGIFLLWPLLIYFLFSTEIKSILTKLAVVISVSAMINALFFPGSYGFLTINFIFSEKIWASRAVYFMNLLILATSIILVLFLIRRFTKIMLPSMLITVCAMLAVGSMNSIKISKEFNSFQSQYAKAPPALSYEPVFQFSKEGKNVLVIMLDKAMSGYIPYIFNERQELYNSFDGFTWYKNTVSFGGYTNYGSPGIFGGYEYTPLEMQARKDTSLVKKHNEALLLLPRIFLDQDYKVTITDPPYANYSWIPDLSIFDNYSEIHAENMIGRYNKNWLFERSNQETKFSMTNDVFSLIKSNLLRFSFFKFAPVLFRNLIYDNGDWLSCLPNVNMETLNNYIALDILEEITEIDSRKFNTYTAITNNLPHEPNFLQAPDYFPLNKITDKGNGPFANEEHYHINIAALLLLGKWFDYLKENGVYDNTRIIIVSDHGRNLYSKFPDNIILPDNSSLQYYAPFLMVKDFDFHGVLSIDNSFMTNADVPAIALEGIVENPVNPWSGKTIKSDKEDGITLTTSSLWDVNRHPENVFDIKPNEWLHVHTNIYDSENWSQVTIP